PAGPLRFDLSAAESEQTTQAEKAAKEGVTVTAENESAGEETAMMLNLTATETTGEGILGYQFELLYDAAVIEPQAASCDVSETISRGMTAICHASESGVLKVVVFGTTPMSGTGTLLKLNFNVVGARGSTSPLSIKNFMFNEDSPQQVTTDGQVLVGDSRTETISIGRHLFTAVGQSTR
ncbi:MAG: cohesin domain-containing protein, partial [Acidobacteriota bacterium]|nr:cohesin domain-containing protein [Acidobacteriota bacterium]